MTVYACYKTSVYKLIYLYMKVYIHKNVSLVTFVRWWGYSLTLFPLLELGFPFPPLGTEIQQFSQDWRHGLTIISTESIDTLHRHMIKNVSSQGGEIA